VVDCSECGINLDLPGARVDEVDGEKYCRSCSPINECSRCQRSTQATTLDGTPLCQHCQEKRADEDTTRELEQEGLDAY